MGNSEWTRICDASELTAETPMLAFFEERAVCLFRIDGEVYATADTCSHGSASLSDGEVFGYEVECPYHQGRFDVRTGAASRLPCRTAIETFDAAERNDAVWVRPKGEQSLTYSGTGKTESDEMSEEP